MILEISTMPTLEGVHVQHRKLSKEELETMAERLSRVEKKEKKEPRAHPMQLKYEFNSKSRKYTERYIRAKKVSSDAQTEYLKALAERCVAKQQQTEAALRQKYLKPLNPNAKKLTKADMEEHMAKVQRLFQGQGVVDKP